MDHIELKKAIEKRLDKTDEKIDRNMEEVKALREDLHKDHTDLAVLKNQMSGIVKISLILVSSVISIIAYAFKQGL